MKFPRKRKREAYVKLRELEVPQKEAKEFTNLYALCYRKLNKYLNQMDEWGLKGKEVTSRLEKDLQNSYEIVKAISGMCPDGISNNYHPDESYLGPG